MDKSNIPVAKDWYSATSYQHGVTRISTPYIDPYWSGNIWMIPGSERTLMVDTGNGITSPLPLIESMTTKPIIAAVSCYYYDHAGGLQYFDQRFCHKQDADAISDPNNEMGAEYFRECARFSAVPSAEFELSSYQLAATLPTGYLDDGDTIDLGNRQVEVLHIPGRTPGSLAFWEEETGCLFGGETLFIDPQSNHFPPDDIQSYESSLLRLGALSVSTVYGGHFEPFSQAELLALIDSEIGRYV